MEQYYFDTSIWVDIYDQRGKNGAYATALIEKIINEGGIILYSDIILVELKQIGFSDYEMLKVFNPAKPDHLRRLHITKVQIEHARTVARQRDVPWRDVLHAILARDNGAQLISRDRDYEQIRGIVKAKKPEELIDIDA